MQIINNAVRLLMQANIFPLKEFDNWEAITPKTYTALKTFIARAFMRCILAQQLRNKVGQMGYVPQNTCIPYWVTPMMMTQRDRYHTDSFSHDERGHAIDRRCNDSSNFPP
jgi:hypothetical protein